jgi:signal transduction histidine kinase
MSRAIKAKVMVVEDEKTAALDIQKILQSLGHTVISIALSGEEALRELERLEKLKNLKILDGNKPDLALIDTDLLEKGDGIEVAHRIRALFDVPVVYLIDSTDEGSLELARATEPFGYILKPFEEREFLTTIEKAFSERTIEKKLTESQEQLHNLSLHLQSVRERESTRIAREIHDELGHLLTALKMDLSWLYKRLPKGQKSLLDITKSMSKLTDTIIKTVQRISLELKPVILDDLGLVPAIEWQAQEFEDRTRIKCKVTINCGNTGLDLDRSTALFRIFQEALTNIARHANATEIKVSLKERPGLLLLKIEDNGRGITKEQISNSKSFGLIGMQERVYPWGGNVQIKGLPNKGTALTVILPLS